MLPCSEEAQTAHMKRPHGETWRLNEEREMQGHLPDAAAPVTE